MAATNIYIFLLSLFLCEIAIARSLNLRTIVLTEQCRAGQGGMLMGAARGIRRSPAKNSHAESTGRVTGDVAIKICWLL